jgi:hypothetical protein
MLPIKTRDQMPLHLHKEVTYCNEMNDEILDIDMDMWNIARNVTKPISFHPFHRQSQLTMLI